MAEVEDTLTIILRTVKEGLGIPVSVITFDPIIIVNINATFMILHSLGVGPTTVFTLVTGTETWADFFGSIDDPTFALIKSYVGLKVKLLFDPPTSGVVTASLERVINEFESRLLYQVTATA